MSCLIAETALALAQRIREANEDRSRERFAEAMNALRVWIETDAPDFGHTLAHRIENLHTEVISADALAWLVAGDLQTVAMRKRRECQGGQHPEHRLCSP